MAPEIFFLALALGCDAFAVGLGVGPQCGESRQLFRLAFHFGLFQFLMPLVGWGLGRHLARFFLGWGPWISCALLVFIGIQMIRDAISDGSHGVISNDPTKGWSLVGLSLGTSMDALGAGFSYGIVGRRLFMAAVVIGLTAGGMTWAAMKLGRSLAARWGRRISVLGGMILVGIGIGFVV